MAAKSEGMEKWYRSPGYVYFVGVGERPDAIKIGISTQGFIKRRLGSLQCGNHEPLALLGVIPVDAGERPMAEAERIERELHATFAGLQRFRKGWAGSEWFTASPEILAVISERAVSPASRGLPRRVTRPGPGRPWDGE